MIKRNEWFTPADAELVMMAESLTGGRVETFVSREGISFKVFYPENCGDMMISAIMDAVRGRLGKRLLSLYDHPDAGYFIATANISAEELPAVYGDERDAVESKFRAGTLFSDGNMTVRAVQFVRERADDASSLCGGGEMRIDGRCGVTFHFTDGSVFFSAAEFDYICRREDGAFFVMPPSVFRMKFNELV